MSTQNISLIANVTYTTVKKPRKFISMHSMHAYELSCFVYLFDFLIFCVCMCMCACEMNTYLLDHRKAWGTKALRTKFNPFFPTDPTCAV